MKSITDFLNEALVVERKKESYQIEDWADYAKKNFKGDKKTLDKFIGHLEYLANMGNEWEEMRRYKQLDDFLCKDIWTEFEPSDKDVDKLHDFWVASYKEYFDI